MLGERRAARELDLTAGPSTRRAVRRPRRAGAAGVLVAALAALAACGGDGAAATGTPAPDAPAEDPSGLRLSGLVRSPTPQIRLDPVTDIDGAPFSFQAEPGALQLLYFGYLSCPDVCPTTFADLRVALAGLDDEAAAVDVAMITVDPERDNAENLRSYLDHFVEGGRGIRIDDPTLLRSVADTFGATYAVETVDGVVEVSHSAFVYVLDDAGRLLVQWPFGTPAEDMTRDLQALSAPDGARAAETPAAAGDAQETQ